MPDANTTTRLLMNRTRFQDMKIDTVDAPSAGEGEVVFALDRFSLTINNITYATFGDALHYWDFFPTGVEGYGLLPVWGYADVVDSSVDGIEPGQRYFGYYPSATHLVVRPGKTGGRSFRDDSPHRAELPEVYNWYQRTDNDEAHTDDAEPLHAIFRPLFVTAFGLSDQLAENDFHGADQVVISSASSRTGYSEAFGIGLQRDSVDRNIDVVGLTSAGHRDFVESLGLYTKVLAYDDLDQLDPNRRAVYVDIAGNTDLQRRVHEHFGDALVHDAALGAAHAHQPPQPHEDLPGPKPEFFFAPVWVARRQKEWGSDEFNRRVGEAVRTFFSHVIQHKLIDVREQHGFDPARDVLTELLAGKTDPAVGHVIRVYED